MRRIDETLSRTPPCSEALQDHDDDHDQHGEGNDAPSAPGVEVEKRRAPRRVSLSQENTGDDESRNDKEHVDTDAAAKEPRDEEVKEEHEQNRHRSHPLDIRSKLAIPWSRSRLVARLEEPPFVRSRHRKALWLPIP